MRSVVGVLVVGVVVAACGGSSEPSAPPQAPSVPFVGACGMQVFRTPACQGALDTVCCPLETECARDPACAELQQCVVTCKATTAGRATDNCTDGCAVRTRVAHCQDVCRGRGDACTTPCIQNGAPGEPFQKWAHVASCSKGVNYPPGVQCNDKS